MKKILVGISALLFALSVHAADKVTALITVTNGTVNGNTLTVNGGVRTFTNVVFQTGSQIQTNATPGGTKTNAFTQIALNPFPNVQIQDLDTNEFYLIASGTSPLIVTASAGMTIAHQSGVDPVPANRILCMTGGDESTTGNGAAILIYSGAASRWLLISLKQ